MKMTLLAFNETIVANLSGDQDSADPTGAGGGAPASITITGTGFEAVANTNPKAYDNYNEYAGAVNEEAIPLNGANPYWTTTLNVPAEDSEFVFDNSMAFGDREFSIRGSNPVGESKRPRSTLIDPISRIVWAAIF